MAIGAIGAALPSVVTTLPTAQSGPSGGSGLAKSFGDFFGGILDTGSEFLSGLAQAGQERLIDKIVGTPLVADNQSQAEQQAAAQKQEIFGVPTDTALLIGGGALAVLAVIVLLR